MVSTEVAARGGVYSASALVWLSAFEGHRPDPWGLVGAAIGHAGTAVIELAPRRPA